MKLKELGYSAELEEFVQQNNLSGYTIGRITQEHRERYIVSTGVKEFDAEITGNLRFSAKSITEYPAVGDWVAMAVYDDNMAVIHSILPRKSVLERQAVGKHGEKQIISSNVDSAFIIQSIDNNFNINRLERYLTICHASGIEPVLIISKIDLSSDEEIKNALKSLKSRNRNVETLLLSNVTRQGIDQIKTILQKGKTYCIVGSSGVGKSTLINNLLQEEVLKTDTISQSTNKGKHVTSHRELFVLDNGAIIIDTPGMRELGITDSDEGIKTSFDEIVDVSLTCKFSDCTHQNESGCAILRAVEDGIIDPDTVDNFKKIRREQLRFQSTTMERRKKDRELGKLYKSIMKEKKNSKP